MYKKLKLVESTKLDEKLNSFEKNTFSKRILDAKTDEDIKKIVYEIKPYSEPTYTKCMEILNGDGSTQYKAGQISDILYQLNESDKLKEDSTEEYWDATEIARDGFMSLMKFNFGTDSKGNNYIITVDANDVKRFGATSDDEAIEIYNKFKENWNNSDHADLTMNVKSIAPRNESAKLTEADDEIEDLKDKAKEDIENQEDLEDTVDSEEDQEENPIEEESELDTQLNELRDILVDLDLNLYQITDKEDLNNSIYIIGKVAEDSDDVLMLVDTKPEEVNSEEIPEEEPIIDNIDTDEELKESEEPAPRKLTREEFNKEFGPGANPDVINAGREPENRIEIIEESEDIEWSQTPIAEHNGNELYKSINTMNIEGVDYVSYLEKDKDGNGVRSFILPATADSDLKASKKLEEAEEIDLENNEESEEDEHKTELEQRFDFVKLPNTFDEINKLNPRYGEELTPDHEAIVEYLMNCLIEINPEAAEELQNDEEPEETPMEPDEDIDLDIDINGEEDLEDED